MAFLLSDYVWEGLQSEMAGVLATARNGHVYKQLDTGESYIKVHDSWQFINLGLSFIKATKSGTGITDVNGDFFIIFQTPFINSDYSVALTVTDPGHGKGVFAYFVSKTPQGLVVKTRQTNGSDIGNVTFSWLATRDYNP